MLWYLDRQNSLLNLRSRIHLILKIKRKKVKKKEQFIQIYIVAANSFLVRLGMKNVVKIRQEKDDRELGTTEGTDLDNTINKIMS